MYLSLRIVRLSVMAFLLAAMATLSAGRNALWGDSAALWEDTARKSPKKGRPFNNLGLAYKKVGRAEDAADAFGRAVSNDPENVEAYVNLAGEYWSEGRYMESVGLLDKAIAIRPIPDAYMNLAIALLRLDMPEAALGNARMALLLNPHGVAAYNTLGAVYIRLGRFSEAVSVLNEARTIDPDYPTLYFNLARAYHFMGDGANTAEIERILDGMDEKLSRKLPEELQKGNR